MNTRSLKLILPGVAVVLAAGCAEDAREVSFSKEVKPVLDRYCMECHLADGEGTAASGFMVDSYDDVMKGTKLGPMVVPGDALSSNLYRLVAGEVHPSIAMPHGKERLTAEDIATVETWIEQGAKNN